MYPTTATTPAKKEKRKKVLERSRQPIWKDNETTPVLILTKKLKNDEMKATDLYRLFNNGDFIMLFGNQKQRITVS